MKLKDTPVFTSSQSSSGSALLAGLAFACILGGIVCCFFGGCSRPVVEPVVPPATSAAAIDYSPLFGKWRREDGEYILEIRAASPDGKLEALYFNPSRINVGKAMGMIDGGKLTALVELRDVNYPGSTYRLRHNGTKLVGDYFQATQGETFQVEFTRLP